LAYGAPSGDSVIVARGGQIVVKTSRAEFEYSPAGYWTAYLLRDGARLTLDRPGPGQSSDGITIDGQAVGPFRISYPGVRITDNGRRGKRIAIPAQAVGAHGATVTRTLVVETDDAVPGMLTSVVTYTNSGREAFHLDQVTTQRHRLDASLADGKARPYQLWSFQGSSSESNLDDVVQLSPRFSRRNVMGATGPDGRGGGVPLCAFWTGRVGIAIGHVDPKPQTLSIPVDVAAEEYPLTAVILDPQVTLKPGESYTTPPTFLAVYAGDYYEPVHSYSLKLQETGWKPARPAGEAYNVSWCGWGYGFDVTPAQMLGVIPKLKSLGIDWATLDDRWFGTYGDWEPRQDTFPGDSIRRMVDKFHENGIYVQLWWVPHAVETAGHKYSSHVFTDSKVAKEHPDWLVLDKSGKPALMIRQLAALCPAVPEVQAYIRDLTAKFVHEWGFDGHKLDNVFSVPPCYNPAHHHKSPYESVYALGEIYRTIFETTRKFKPYGVTQICPCHTPPNIAWLPYLDQAVTADPTGGPQVRRRIKLYKALLGADAAVYGDHVELVEYSAKPEGRVYTGPDFASTIGAGGIVGTKFSWPPDGPRDGTALTPERERLWAKWIGMYRDHMLSRGEFENLYTYGYDVPEGYAIRKDGRMYYAFFAAYPDARWQGEIELRGLPAGQYRVFDYGSDRAMGTVDARMPRMRVDFTGNLLLEVTPR
jgi:alpha-galactosidase